MYPKLTSRRKPKSFNLCRGSALDDTETVVSTEAGYLFQSQCLPQTPQHHHQSNHNSMQGYIFSPRNYGTQKTGKVKYLQTAAYTCAHGLAGMSPATCTKSHCGTQWYRFFFNGHTPHSCSQSSLDKICQDRRNAHRQQQQQQADRYHSYGSVDNTMMDPNTGCTSTSPHATNSGGKAAAPRIPFEFEASTQRQFKLSRSIKHYAVGLCAFAVMAVALLCLTKSYNHIYTTEDSSIVASHLYSSVPDEEERPHTLGRRRKVQQPKKLEDIPEHDSMIRELRKEFLEWAQHHGRDYGVEEEKEKRFHVWKENHFRTQEKNERHGPCKMTGQAVFGSNHFKDLTPEEFQSKYLTGYTGPHTDEIPGKKRKLRSDVVMKKKNEEVEDILKTIPQTKRRVEPVEVLSSNGLHDPRLLSETIIRHESVQDRYLKHLQDAPLLDKTYYSREEKNAERICKCGSNSNNNNQYNYNNQYDYNNQYNNQYDYNNQYNNQYGYRFLKTYYNKSEKQKICGSGYSKTYYSKNSNGNKSSNIDCSKYKLEAGKDFETSDAYKNGGSSCSWWDASCWLRDIFAPLYTSSSENKYKNYNYPSSIDWRDIGAVTTVHSQGSCGACWAITAVETIESVNYIKTGVLTDLSEKEVIICDTSCEMCSGGWPQNAYDYVIENGGLPVEGGYDGDFLMTMTSVKAGDSDELTESQMESIYESTCPNSDNSGSQDNNDDRSGGERYGKINAYAYATDRCVCYTDGSGCDCDEQNEALAVMNVASYGPATICLEASTWQDYTGGIITTDSGCSSAFLDMNHCVQTVGYAFQEVEDENGNSSSGSNDGNKKLEGYWIVRNQWSSYWGMNGYAYVAMGSNTCGILNDMTQVFM